MPWSALLLTSLPLVWLIPQHYLPWLAAHHDAAALALVAIAGLLSVSGQALPRTWGLATATALLVIALQFAFHEIPFGGDAWMASLFVLAFAGAIAIGVAVGRLDTTESSHWLDAPAVGCVAAAILSVAIALMQWTWTDSLPLPVNFLARGDRPYANFAQANNFCTALFLGFCALCWLREARRIGPLGWLIGSLFLLFGMTMSGSRTGWLQMLVAFALLCWAGRRTDRPLVLVPHALALLASFAVMTLAWPAFNDLLLLSGGRAASDQVQAGLRLPIWQMVVDAISRQPMKGYGWLQNSSAQWSVALDHSDLQRYIDYSHSLLLDLLIWAGLPLGGLIAALAGWGLYRQSRAINDARALWLFAGVLGFFVHALLELPHAYAYLLLPVGVSIGMVHTLCPGQASLRLRPTPLAVAWLVMLAAIMVTAIDYLKVEQNYRAARLVLAFGERRIVTPAPDLQVLSQLGAFMQLIRTEARPGMSLDELNAMHKVVMRYPHPPALLRLALAQGLNGRPDDARDTLRRLCAMHLAARCAEMRATWHALRLQHSMLPVLEPPAQSQTR